MDILKKKDVFKEDEAKKQILEQCYAKLAELDPGTEEFEAVIEQINDLHKSDKERVSPNTVANGLFSTIPIIGIIVYEGFGNIIKTKALSFVSKVRL